MTIPEKSWIKYINMLSAVSKTAARKFTAYLNDPGHDILSKAGRKAAIDYAAALADAYGESAAAVACQMYDAAAEASKVTVPPAVPAPTPEYGEVAKAVNGMLKHNQGSDAIGASIGRLVKRTGVDTTLQNALRDGAEFAWVPHGDTCSFCIMLASNGWQKASKKTIKGDHAEHVHANCDCTFAVRFDGKSGVKGYDPDKYREIFDNAEGNNWKEKLRSMERDEREAHKDEINARKRELYAEKNERKYLGVPKTWEKTLEAAEDEILRGTNPEYKPGLSKYASAEKLDYNDNCANSVVAYEMRCRGYDVTAQPYSANKKLSTNPFSAWEDGEGKVIATKNIDAISEYMESMPDGARVQVALKYPKSAWYDLTDHTFIVERKSGKTVFKDPQSGTIIANTNDAFRGAELFEYLRIDNVDITDRGISACKRRN